MIKKRLTLSLVALVGSVFLFIVAAFAWFAVTEVVDLMPNIVRIKDIDVDATLYVSSDNINFSETNSINIDTAVPGDSWYYKLVVTNNNTFSVSTHVTLQGLNESFRDGTADTSNFLAGKSLLDITFLDASNSVNAEVIIDQSLDSLAAGGDSITTHSSVDIEPMTTVELYFSLTISSAAGNDYQNLSLSIDNLFVMSTDG